MGKSKAELINKLIDIEAGYVDDPDDSGGETKYGITIKVARAYGYAGSMRDLSIETAKEILDRRYWKSLNLDKIYGISEKIAYELFDTGANMGVSRAGRFLQRALNLLTDDNDLKVDGKVGEMTLMALKKYLSKRPNFKSSEKVLLRMLNSQQGAFYMTLGERRVKDERFMYGWFLNRVE
jgi:lysozyme family protein